MRDREWFLLFLFVVCVWLGLIVADRGMGVVGGVGNKPARADDLGDLVVRFLSPVRKAGPY